MRRSSTSSSTRTASVTIFTCSTRSYVSGRTTTITTVRTEVWAGRPRTNGCSRKRELKCHQGLKTLHSPNCVAAVIREAEEFVKREERMYGGGRRFAENLRGVL